MDAAEIKAGWLELGGLLAQQLPSAAVAVDRWPALAQLARAEHLAPVLHWVLRQADFTLPGDLADQLHQAAQRVAFLYLAQLGAQQQLQREFVRAGASALWLKGIVLAKHTYPAPGLRPMTDLDVLVPAAARDSTGRRGRSRLSPPNL